ncbi:hypothetical protein WICPIJ_007328 [Wickerhamomyces pijperi]|uniref:Protein kinase domain-containing protein n=1 Tax=Wickerhamomyces pijperi TaxID=599730 RepID=A0A9P8TKJ9_WICPI|nr:hypothetical protein WICPIJ_007328 [Wickerhamomyces pijperi]
MIFQHPFQGQFQQFQGHPNRYYTNNNQAYTPNGPTPQTVMGYPVPYYIPPPQVRSAFKFTPQQKPQQKLQSNSSLYSHAYQPYFSDYWTPVFNSCHSLKQTEHPESEKWVFFRATNTTTTIRKTQLHNRVYTPSSGALLGKGGSGTVVSGKFIRDNKYYSANQRIYDPRTLIYNHDMHHQQNYFNNSYGMVAVKTLTSPYSNSPSESETSSIREVLEGLEVAAIFNVPNHPNLLLVYDVIVQENSSSVHIITEKMDFSLPDFIRLRKSKDPNFKFTAEDIMSIAYQILAALQHLHRYGYMHCDIKPDNILITQVDWYYSSDYINKNNLSGIKYVVKICDYGQVSAIVGGPRYGCLGTLGYNSPEMALGYGEYNEKSDIWCFGLVLYYLMCHDHLFKVRDSQSYLNKLIRLLGTPRSSLALTLGVPEHLFDQRLKEVTNLYGYDERISTMLINKGFNRHYEQRGIKLQKHLGRHCLEGYDKITDIAVLCMNWDKFQRPSAFSLIDQFFQNEKIKAIPLENQWYHRIPPSTSSEADYKVETSNELVRGSSYSSNSESTILSVANSSYDMVKLLS